MTRWPNLFVVGTARAGTTSLWHYLRGHPEIYMKEPHYFSGRRPVYVPTVSTESDYLELPVARLYSHNWHAVRYGHERRSVEEALIEPVATSPALPSTRHFRASFYADPGARTRMRSASTCSCWFDDLARDVRGFVHQILDFLGVDPAYAATFDTTLGTGVPSRGIPRLQSSMPRHESARPA